MQPTQINADFNFQWQYKSYS